MQTSNSIIIKMKFYWLHICIKNPRNRKLVQFPVFPCIITGWVILKSRIGIIICQFGYSLCRALQWYVLILNITIIICKLNGNMLREIWCEIRDSVDAVQDRGIRITGDDECKEFKIAFLEYLLLSCELCPSLIPWCIYWCLMNVDIRQDVLVDTFP